MKLTIDNNQRKFLVQSLGSDKQKDVFCNLEHIQEVLETQFEKNEGYNIFEYWNRRLKKCTKEHLNDMFKANRINFKIN